MPRSLVRLFALSLVISAISLPAAAATRLTYTMSDKVVGVKWPQAAFPIRFQADARLVSSLPPGTIDRAFAMWSALPDADIRFEGSVVNGVKAGYDNVNTVSIADGLFANQNALALTSNWYDRDGQLTEADIQIDASLPTSKYNVQQAVAHEIGHLLGLDHSAVLSAIMFPYLPRANTDAPQLDSDDRIGIATIYPKVDPALHGGTLQGRVMKDSRGVFAAQVVAVNDRGEPVATALSDSTGEFTLTGLPAGNYRVYAEPLDGPVDNKNLAGIYREAGTAFPTSFYDASVRVDSGRKVGNVIVSTDGPPPQLNPKWIGAAEGTVETFNFSSSARYVKAGQTVTLAVAGDGITGGMTEFEVLNPAFSRTGGYRYMANYVFATFSIAPDAGAGSSVILVRSGGQTATLTGALRIAANAATTKTRAAGR